MENSNEEMVLYSGGRYAARSRRRKKSLLKSIIACVLCGAAFGGAFAASFRGVNSLLQDRVELTVEAQTAEETVTDASAVTSLAQTSPVRGGMDVSDIAGQSLPGVVSITNISVQEVQSYFRQFGFGGPSTRLEESTSCGSGVIISQDDSYYYIVTNAHVVEDASTLTVGFSDGSAYDAALCGADSELDLAVIKVKTSDLTEETRGTIRVISVGNSADLLVGEQVVAIGNALGYGQSVTTGIVSALNRSISSDGSGAGYIQTDAAINPGNSGGALLNLQGELVGINSAKQASTEVEGMGYAIPITDVIGRIAELMEQDTPLAETIHNSYNNVVQEPYFNPYFR